MGLLSVRIDRWPGSASDWDDTPGFVLGGTNEEVETSNRANSDYWPRSTYKCQSKRSYQLLLQAIEASTSGGRHLMDYAHNFGGTARDSIDGSTDNTGPPRPITDVLARCLEAVGAALLLLTLVTSSLVWSLSGTELTGELYLAANVCLFAAVILDRRRGGVTLLVRFFFLFFVAIPALVQIESGVYPWKATYDAVELAAGYQILTVGQIALIAGALIFDTREQRGRNAISVSPPHPHFYRVAMLVLTCTAAAVLLYLGSDVLLATRYEIGAGTDAGEVEQLDLQLLQICRSIILLSVMIGIYLWRRDRASRRDPMFVMTAALTFAVFAVYFYPPALGRFMLLGAILGISAVCVDYFSVAIKAAFAVIAPTFLFFLFPAIKVLGEGRAPDPAEALQSDIHAYMFRVDFDSFKEVIDTWIYIRQGGDWRLGENFLGVVLFWIPRSVWPGKPEGSGQLVAGSLGYDYTNVSNPLPSEAYISFGFSGVVVLCVLFGWWVARLERRTRLSAAQAKLGREVLLYAILMAFAVIILRGAIQGVVSNFGAAFLAYWVLGWIHRRSLTRTAAVSGGRISPRVGSALSTSLAPSARVGEKDDGRFAGSS